MAPTPQQQHEHSHRRGYVPWTMVVFVCTTVLALGATLSVAAYYHTEYSRLQEAHADLVNQQERREAAVRELVLEIHSVRDQFSAFKERNRDVLGMLGLDEDPPIGGPEERDIYSYVYRVQERELMERLRNDLEALKPEIESEAKVQSVLGDYIEGREELLAMLPSGNPAPDGIRTSPFSMRKDPFTGEYRMHKGLDLACSYKCDIVASGDGVVVGAGYRGPYGNMVTIDHGYGVTTRYAHLSEISVEQGQEVTRGEVLGKMGMTGRATGVHLHYEVLYKGEHVDPAFFILD